MIDHLSTYSTDFESTRRFYEATLGALGHGVQMELTIAWDDGSAGRRMIAFGPEGCPVFWVIEVREASSPRHVAFCALHRAAVAAFHEAGLEAGGSDHGAPGLRPQYHEHYYGAFLVDPDGNNVEAVCHGPEEP